MKRDEGVLIDRWDQEGFQIEVRVIQDDEDGDISWLGEFTNKFCEGAIDRVEAGYSIPRHGYRYFVPPRDLTDPNDIKMNHERAEAYASGAWHFVGIMVTAVWIDNSMWRGTAAVWGVESDSPEHHRELGEDLAADAIAEARPVRELSCWRAGLQQHFGFFSP